MSFSDSSPIKIPLSDPLIRYGKTFQVSDIYLNSSDDPRTSYHLPASSSSTAVYQQNFQSEYLSIKWNVIDPSNDYVLTTKEEVIDSPYISGFNVAIYENSGDLTGLNVLISRNKIFERSGIKDNGFDYIITGSRDKRNYSADVTVVDFTGNQSKGILTSKNSEPNFSITGTGMSAGVFSVYYSGRMSSKNVNLSNGFQGLGIYLFSGLNSGKSGLFSQEEDFIKQARRVGYGSAFNGEISIELEPGLDNYIMAVGGDQYNTGSISGLYAPRTYLSQSGFTGMSGNIHRPALIPYPIEINTITGHRVNVGDAIYYSFAPTYPTGSSLIKTCYGVRSTGQTTGAVSGYNKEIYFDSGEAYDPTYGAYNTGSQIVYDNSLPLQRGFYTGTMIERVESTGGGFTGYQKVGSGAGAYWEENSPKYTSNASGKYQYGYYDGSIERFGSASEYEVSNSLVEIEGIYSMPANDPNSYEINFRDGANFTKSYEQASSYLNAIGEMPAVILNNSQLSKIKSMGQKRGWVGMRRGTVCLLSGLFSENYINQTFFEQTNFTDAVASGINVSSPTGGTEHSELYARDVGDKWCWVNGSGTAIYKYAGSGYNKIRTSRLSIDAKRILDNTGYYLTADQVGDDAYLLTQAGGMINLQDDLHIGLQHEGYYYPVYITSDEAGFPCNIYVINGRKFYTPRSQPLSIAESLPGPNIYKEYLEPFITGITMSGDAPAPEVSGCTIETGNVGFNFDLTINRQYYNETIADPADPNYNNFNLTKVDLYTGVASGITPSSGNLSSTFTDTTLTETESGRFNFQGSLSGENPEFFKFILYDKISSGEAFEVSGHLTPTLNSQSITQSLDGLVSPPANAIDVTFPYLHSSPPIVSYTLGYTGVGGSIGYMGAMIVGEPTESGVTFALTAAPSSPGYVLYIETAAS